MHSKSNEFEYYRAIVPSTFQFDAVLKAVGSSLSFRQTVKVFEGILVLYRTVQQVWECSSNAAILTFAPPALPLPLVESGSLKFL